MLEILYPRRCAVCDEIEVTGKGICPLCKDKVHVAGEPACKKCGKPLVDERKEFCTDCGKKHHVYTQGKAVFVYEGGIRNSMYRFKYGNKREYAEFYANAAVEKYGVWLNKIKAEVLIPIPMYSRKKRLRGYNQAEYLAEGIAGALHAEVDGRSVVRSTYNRSQTAAQARDERWENVRGIFSVRRPERLAGRHVLLVDDVLTTGATLVACGETILRAVPDCRISIAALAVSAYELFGGRGKGGL